MQIAHTLMVEITRGKGHPTGSNEGKYISVDAVYAHRKGNRVCILFSARFWLGNLFPCCDPRHPDCAGGGAATFVPQIGGLGATPAGPLNHL